MLLPFAGLQGLDGAAHTGRRGGILLQMLVLNAAMFDAAIMEASNVSFEEMKLAQLKEELAARGSTRTGLKASLQRRLHGLLVQAAIVRRAPEEEAAGVAAGSL